MDYTIKKGFFTDTLILPGIDYHPKVSNYTLYNRIVNSVFSLFTSNYKIKISKNEAKILFIKKESLKILLENHLKNRYHFLDDKQIESFSNFYVKQLKKELSTPNSTITLEKTFEEINEVDPLLIKKEEREYIENLLNHVIQKENNDEIKKQFLIFKENIIDIVNKSDELLSLKDVFSEFFLTSAKNNQYHLIRFFSLINDEVKNAKVKQELSAVANELASLDLKEYPAEIPEGHLESKTRTPNEIAIHLYSFIDRMEDPIAKSEKNTIKELFLSHELSLESVKKTFK